MRFLIDEDLPRGTANLLKQFGHEAIDIRDTGLRGAPDPEIARYAQENSLCLITGDFDFSDIRNYPPDKYKGSVVLSIPKDSAASFILNLIKEFLNHTQLTTGIAGKLVIVEAGRIRVRKS